MAIAASTDRKIELDALRGFAVMGILAMNIVGFAMPEMAYVIPDAAGPQSIADMIAWLASFVLIDGKTRGLFSLLFGASMLLIAERAEAKGESAAAVHYRRMLWLALFGLAHFFLIWWGDILFLYAIIGCIAFAFRGLEAERLFRLALILYALGFAIWALTMGSLLLLERAALAPGADAAMTAQYQDILAGFAASPGEFAIYRSSYADIVMYKLTELWTAPLIVLLQSCLETLPLMLIGMALFKTGFLTGEWAQADYRRWAVRGIIGGGGGFAALAGIAYASDFSSIIMMNIFVAWSVPFRLLMVMGYAAALLIVIQRWRSSGMMARVAAAGQAAFTNYLGTSIIMTSIFYGYGLGLFGQIGRAELYLFVPPMCALMLLWSAPWLARFHYGPFEWLWRSLARGHPQPFRKSPPARF